MCFSCSHTMYLIIYSSDTNIMPVVKSPEFKGIVGNSQYKTHTYNVVFMIFAS